MDERDVNEPAGPGRLDGPAHRHGVEQAHRRHLRRDDRSHPHRDRLARRGVPDGAVVGGSLRFDGRREGAARVGGHGGHDRVGLVADLHRLAAGRGVDRPAQDHVVADHDLRGAGRERDGSGDGLCRSRNGEPEGEPESEPESEQDQRRVHPPHRPPTLLPATNVCSTGS